MAWKVVYLRVELQVLHRVVAPSTQCNRIKRSACSRPHMVAQSFPQIKAFGCGFCQVALDHQQSLDFHHVACLLKWGLLEEGDEEFFAFLRCSSFITRLRNTTQVTDLVGDIGANEVLELLHNVAVLFALNLQLQVSK